jgi:hypothetical protein
VKNWFLQSFCSLIINLQFLLSHILCRYAQIEFRENTADDPGRRKPDITKAKELLGWVGRCELTPVDTPQLESAWMQTLNLKCDILVSKFAFKFNLCRYSWEPKMTLRQGCAR